MVEFGEYLHYAELCHPLTSQCNAEVIDGRLQPGGLLIELHRRFWKVQPRYGDAAGEETQV